MTKDQVLPDLGVEPEQVPANSLRATAEYQAFILGAIGAAAFELDTRTRQLHGSVELKRLYGIADGAPLPLSTVWARTHPADRVQLRRIWKAARRAGQLRWELEYRIVVPAGDRATRWVLVRGEIVRGADGAPELVRGAAFDITERKQAEARQAFLLQLSDRLRSLADPMTIQYEAARTLGAYLGATRVGYAEVQPDAETIVVTRNYTDGVPEIAGRYRFDDYGPALLRELAAGRTVVRPDIAADPTLTADEKAAHAALQLGASVNIPLVKAGCFVAVLFVHCDAARTWSDHEIALMAETANRTWDAVERARAEAARQEAATKYKTLLASIDQGYCVIQLIFDAANRPVDYRYLEINPAFERQTGLPHALGRTIQELMPGIEHHWFEFYGRVALTGEPARVVDRAAVLDRWFEVYAFRIGEPDARTVAVLFSDITDRKHAEAALRDSEARFRLMVDAVPQSIWITDAYGRAEFLNKQWCDYAGIEFQPTTAAEIAAEFLHPEDGPKVMAAFGEAMRAQQPFEVEQRNRSAHGEYRWFLNRANPYRDPATGEISKWFGVGVDIHDRKQAEEALRASEERFRAVADLVPDLLWSSDAGGALEWCNQRWYDYTSQTPDEARGYGWVDVIHPDDRDMALRHAQLAVTTGEPLRLEQRMRRADGAYRWFLVRAVPVHEADGTIKRWYGACADVHEERVALAEAQAALETRDQFLSIASHELRTPLTALMGYAQRLPIALARGTGDPVRIAGIINRQAARLSLLIGQLLDVTRLQQGQFAVEHQPVDVAALVTQTVEEFRIAQADGRHPITLEVQPEPVVVQGDASRLEQVIQNLLTNAVKYSPDGGPVEVRLTATPTETALAVADQGIGIPAESRARLFDAFFRADNVGDHIRGFGLGLHIVGEIVQRHGGRIEIESAEGSGSTFRVVLPRSTLSAPARQAEGEA